MTNTDNPAASAPQPLLDCPFCGSEAQTKQADHIAFVFCPRKDCGGGPCSQAYSMSEAIRAWNRRTDAANAALVAQVEALTQRNAELEAQLAVKHKAAWGAYEFWDNPLDDEYNKESEGGNE